jgi:hypothetical protein
MLNSVRSLSILVFFFFTVAFVTHGQSANIPKGWKVVEKCGLRFQLPKSMNDKSTPGTDSCTAVYSNERLGLSIDYGWYSGVGRDESYLDFQEQEISIDGRVGQFATYKDSGRRKDRQYVARIYVSIDPPLAMNMFINYGDPKELEIARSIFQSIRFLKGPVYVNK